MFTMLLLRMFPLEMHYVKKTLTFKLWSMEYIDQTCAVKLTFFMYIYFSLLSKKVKHRVFKTVTYDVFVHNPCCV